MIGNFNEEAQTVLINAKKEKTVYFLFLTKSKWIKVDPAAKTII